MAKRLSDRVYRAANSPLVSYESFWERSKVAMLEDVPLIFETSRMHQSDSIRIAILASMITRSGISMLTSRTLDINAED